MTERLVRFDWAMKNLLRNKTNFEILEGFLSELTRQDIRIEKIGVGSKFGQYDY